MVTQRSIGAFNMHGTAASSALWLVIVLLWGGCSSSAPARPMLEAVVVSDAGAESGGEFCSDFALTPKQVLDFFSRAKAIDPSALHADFDYLPCWVRGYAVRDGGAVTWEIRAGGTGQIAAADGQVTLYGCSNCDDLLGGGH